MKVCGSCKEEKSLDNFSKNKRSPDGLQFNCKSCANNYARTNYSENRERYFAQAKAREAELDRIIVEAKSKPCKDCGVQYPPFVMDFDHRNPSEKLLGLAVMRRRRMAFSLIRAEIDKCDVVCSNSHRGRTNNQNPARYTKVGEAT